MKTAASNRETEALLGVLKKLLKERKKTYAELARHLELSVPSIKRAMNSSSLPLHRVAEICDFLGITLFDLLSYAKREHTEGFRFTEEQEEFFAKNPSYLVYFLQVVDNSPAELEEKHGLSRRSTLLYLKKLEHMGLLELHPGDLVKTGVKGPILWSDHGTLGQRFSRSMIEHFARHASSRLSRPGEMLLELQGWRLTEEEFAELKREYKELVGKYREISSFNRRIRGKAGTRYISAMTIMDEWEDPLFQEIKEIAAVKL